MLRGTPRRDETSGWWHDATSATALPELPWVPPVTVTAPEPSYPLSPTAPSFLTLSTGSDTPIYLFIVSPSPSTPSVSF